MSLRAKVLTYLLALHLLFGAIAIWALYDKIWWLLGFELLFAVSLLIGFVLVRAFFVPLDLIRTGTELIREREFASHFRETGQLEMDHLVHIYNRMVDQLRAERLRLEEQNLFLEKVLDASPAGIVTLDHDGLIDAVNPSSTRSLDRSAEDLLGRTLAQLPEPFGETLTALEDGESIVVGVQGRRRLRCRRVSFYDRGFPRVFFLLEELTAELQASERAAYDKLIRMMSHEVHNSVGVVRSLLESCQHYGEQLRPEDRAEFDPAIEVAVTRLLHLNSFMNGLAQVVRIPAPERRPCDLRPLIGDIALLLGPELERHRIALRWDPPESFPEISMDKNQIEQVLVNVLRNAVESIGEDGSVTVALTNGDRGPELTVHDTGDGIPAEAQNQLFAPFFTTKRDGQGIGLTLGREILTQHGFDFALYNHRGGGAEFRIRFPR